MLFKKLIRTAWNYKAQFISMILMIAIGTGVFFGFNIEWYSLEKNMNKFIEDTNYADFRIYSEKGFSDEDIESVNKILGVKEAERIFSINIDVKDTKDALCLYAPEKHVVSKMRLIEGDAYDYNNNGIWLSDRYAKANGYKLGDTINLVYAGMQIDCQIVGLVKSMEHMICVADENQLMPDADIFGFAYVSPKLISGKFGREYYPQISITSDLSKEKLEEELEKCISETILVVPKDEHISYAGVTGEVEEGKTMAAILPVLFLSIAILTMITTMHRIAANEKVQIGTLKALGFNNKRILRHYTSYGLFLGIVGGAIGILLGFGVAKMIMSEDGSMGSYLDIPYWELYMPRFCWVVLVLTVLLQTAISYLSVRKMLAGTAADALRPYTPKKVKAMKIEKTAFFQKLSFATKWNFRDVVRHKTRSAMTIVGVIGCMLLLVGGLGMKDTMEGFIDFINNEVYTYVTKINIVDEADNAEVEKMAKQYNGDWQASSSIKVDGKAIVLDIYDINHNKMRFFDKKDKEVKLGNDGVYICLRLADDYKVGDTITFSPYGQDETYEVKVAGVIRSVMSENITMTKEYAQSIGIPYQISNVYTDTQPEEIDDNSVISGKQEKAVIMSSYDEFMKIMNMMVAIFAIGAVILGTVVLYNLGIMSYVERSRELATLKVVGFKDKHLGKILISQNIWLTVLGVALGLPLGIGVLELLIVMLASEYELSLKLGALTYVVSILVTFGVSFVVGLMVAAKNKNIDMVEALKGRE